MTHAPAPELKVLYDGACPLCAREIGFYRRRAGAEAIEWVDVSAAANEDAAPGLSRAQALARFHVVDAEGRLVSGGAAFARLWEALPGFRLLGRLFRVPPFAWLLDRAYDGFLKIRPRLQARARRCDPADAYPRWLERELRSDHAGETGAVYIYHGILAVSRNERVRAFAKNHLATEREHLSLIEGVLPEHAWSLFTPAWRVAGFLTGALPALCGPRAVFATIDAVESFVDRHYGDQVARLEREGTHPHVRAMLERCRADEVAHRDEARASLHASPGPLIRAWCWMVGAGSAGAVALARRV